jgi:hypothetical protein
MAGRGACRIVTPMEATRELGPTPVRGRAARRAPLGWTQGAVARAAARQSSVAVGSCLVQLAASATIMPTGLPPVASLGIAGAGGAIAAVLRRELLRRPVACSG